MKTQTRTLVAAAAIVLAGVSALLWVAGRYRTMGRPVQSPAAVAAPPREASTPTSPAAPLPPQAAGSGVVSDRAGEAAGSSAVSPDLLREVDAFIAARKRAKEVIEAHPLAFKSLRREATGEKAPSQHVKMFNNQILKYRVRRDGPLAEAGVSRERYAVIRDAYREWIAGRASPDAALGAALELRRKELEAVSLGEHEPVDF